MPAPRVELGLPREQDAFTQPVLQRLEFLRELGMQQRRDAIRLRVVERSVEQQVGVGAESLVASLLPRDRVVPGEPDTKAAGRELVGRDDAVVDDESRDGGIGCCAIPLERVGARVVGHVCVARALERVRDCLSNAVGFDAPLPPLEPSAHGARVGQVFALIQVFLRVAGNCSQVVSSGVAHHWCLRALRFMAGPLAFMAVPARFFHLLLHALEARSRVPPSDLNECEPLRAKPLGSSRPKKISWGTPW